MARDARPVVTLEDFIATTLEQIMAGVHRAQLSIVDEYPGASINPLLSSRPTRRDPYVEFDVAVTAVEGTKQGGGAGINAIGIGGGGAHTESERQMSHVSHIKFSVPIILPDQPSF
jgi:hypothetical protein